MKTTIESMRDLLVSSEAAQRAFDAGVKVTLLLAVLLLAVAIMQRVFRMSAARRASVLLIGAMAVPIIAVTALSAGGQGFALWKFEATASPAVPEVAVQPEVVEVGWVSALVTMFVDGVRREMPAATPAPVVAPSPPATPIEWTTWLLAIWIGGMVLVALRLSLGVWALNRRLHHLARPATDDRLMRSMRRAATELGLSRLPELWIAEDDTTMPMTWGMRRHRVLVPAGADSWDSARLMLVLRHELGHVQRRDCLAGWAIRLLLAPAWFHPLAWLSARHAGDLRERACDDFVSTAGGTEHYARELVAISRRYRPLSDAVAMARPKRMEARLRALFCPNLNRMAAGTISRISTLVAITVLVLPLCFVTSCQTVDANPEPIATPAPKPDPAPVDKIVFRKGEKKVIMKYYEIINLPECLPADEKGLSEALDANDYREIPVATLRKLPQQKGVDLTILPAFPTGRKHQSVIGREFAYPINPHALKSEYAFENIGVKSSSLVRELGNGKLSVDTDFEIGKFVRMDKTAKGNNKPVIATHRVDVPRRTIDNGAGIVVFAHDDVELVQDKVPLLGDIPLLGRLFRSEVENRWRTTLVVSFEVVDP